jgi:penicillin-binding protein 2
LGLKNETLQIIKEGMVGACSPGGTAFPLFNFVPQVACKTGTAEFGPVDEKGHRKTHAWLTAIAPAENSEVVVTVLLEEGGEGSRDAGPVAREILEVWKGLRKPQT